MQQRRGKKKLEEKKKEEGERKVKKKNEVIGARGAHSSCGAGSGPFLQESQTAEILAITAACHRDRRTVGKPWEAVSRVNLTKRYIIVLELWIIKEE